MIELKTLKDCSAENMCCEAYLRAEAIKWIKEFSKETVKGDCDYCGGNHNNDFHNINWIKHFFNISEDDLK
jgi:hypothetical protein